MALSCEINEQLFTFNGKEYNYNEFRALMYDGLLERVPELTTETKEALSTEEGKAKVEEGMSRSERIGRLRRSEGPMGKTVAPGAVKKALVSLIGEKGANALMNSGIFNIVKNLGSVPAEIFELPGINYSQKAQKLGLTGTGRAWVIKEEQRKTTDWNKVKSADDAKNIASNRFKETFSEENIERLSKFDSKTYLDRLTDTLDDQAHLPANVRAAVDAYRSGQQQEAYDNLKNDVEKYRKDALNRWKKYLESENDVYAADPFFQDFVADALSKTFREDYPDTGYPFNAAALGAVYAKMNEGVNVSFDKAYTAATLELARQNVEIGDSQNGWVKIPMTQKDDPSFNDAVAKVQSVSHQNWCTKTYNAAPYIQEGDFWVLVKEGKPVAAIRFKDNNSSVAEIQGPSNDGKIPYQYVDEIKEAVDSGKMPLNDYTKEELEQAVNKAKKAKEIEKKAFETGAKKQFMSKGGASWATYSDVTYYEYPDGKIDVIEGELLLNGEDAKFQDNIITVFGTVYFRSASAKSLEYVYGHIELTDGIAPNLKTVDGNAVITDGKAPALETVSQKVTIYGAGNAVPSLKYAGEVRIKNYNISFDSLEIVKNLHCDFPCYFPSLKKINQNIIIGDKIKAPKLEFIGNELYISENIKPQYIENKDGTSTKEEYVNPIDAPLLKAIGGSIRAQSNYSQNRGLNFQKIYLPSLELIGGNLGNRGTLLFIKAPKLKIIANNINPFIISTLDGTWLDGYKEGSDKFIPFESLETIGGLVDGLNFESRKKARDFTNIKSEYLDKAPNLKEVLFFSESKEELLKGTILDPDVKASKFSNRVQGLATNDGRVYLIEDSISEGSEEGVILHEAFHAMAKEAIGEKAWSALMGRMNDLIANSKEEWVKKAIERATKADTPKDLMAEEVAAYAIEDYANAPASIRKWVDDFIAAIKAAIAKIAAKMPGGEAVFAKMAADPAVLRKIAASALREKAKKTASEQRAKTPSVAQPARFSKKQEGERLIPSDEFNNAIDAAIKNTSDEGWGSMTPEEQATSVAKEATKAMKQSDWFKGLKIKEQRAALAELRSEIAEDFGVKLAPKTEKQQQRAEDAAFNKGEKEGAREEKKVAKEKIKGFREKLKAAIAEKMRVAKEGKEAVKEKERELSEAEKREQKRINKAYSVGVAEGKLGGEIFGMKVGRKQGSKEQIAAFAKARREFVNAVKSVMYDENGKPVIKGEIGARKATALGIAAAKVDPTNMNQVAKFIDYASKVMADVKYAEDIKKAEANKKALRKAAKRKSLPSNYRNAYYELGSIDPSSFDSPSEYNSLAERILRAGKENAPFNTEEVAEFVSEAQVAQDKKYVELLNDELGLEGIDDIDAKELYDAINEGDVDEFLSNKKEAQAKILSDRMTQRAEYARMALEQWAKDNGLLGLAVGRTFSDAQVKNIKDLLLANPGNMTNGQKSTYIRFVEDLVVNDSFGGIAYVAAMSRASNKAAAALQKYGPTKRKFNVGTMMEKIRNGLMSNPDLQVAFFGRDTTMADIQVAIGLAEFRMGKERAQQIIDNSAKEAAEFYYDLIKKHKNAFGQDSLLAEGMVSYLLQKSPAFSVDESFEIAKKIVRQDIAKKLGSNNKKIRKQAEMLENLYNALVKDTSNREELLENLKKYSPGAHESIMFLIDQARKHKDEIREANEMNWDSPSNSADWDYEYYLPIRYEFTNAEPDFLNKNEDGALAAGMRPDRLNKPIQSFGLRRKQKYTSLPKNSTIDYNIRKNAFNSLSSNLWDTYVTPAQLRMQEFLKSPDGVALLGGKENTAFYIEHINRWVNKYADAYRASFGEKLLNRILNGVRRLSTTIAMGGIVEPALKQGVEPLVGGAIMTGPLDTLKNVSGQTSDGAQNLMNKFSIGSRGASAAYKEWKGKVSNNIDKLEEAMYASNFKKGENLYKRLSNANMWVLGTVDTIAAKANWLAYYEQARERQGYKVDDWDNEASAVDADEERQAAAMFAETMVGRTLVVSDVAEAASISQKGKSFYENMFKAVWMPFSSYNIQKHSRRLQDIEDIADPEERAAAIRSLVASLAQDATYAAVTSLVIPRLRVVAGMWLLQTVVNALADEEDDEEKVNILQDYIQLTAFGRLVGLMPGDVFNWFKEASKIQKEQIDDKVAQNVLNTFVADPEMKEIVNIGLELNKQTEKDKKVALAAKKAITSLLTSLGMVDAISPLSELSIDAVNYSYYTLLAKTNDPSVFTKQGKLKEFKQWVKEDENVLLWRYGADTPIWSSQGLLDVAFSAPSRFFGEVKKAKKAKEDAKWLYLAPKAGESKAAYLMRIDSEIEKIKEKVMTETGSEELANQAVDTMLAPSVEIYDESDSEKTKMLKDQLNALIRKRSARE